MPEGMIVVLMVELSREQGVTYYHEFGDYKEQRITLHRCLGDWWEGSENTMT